MSNRFTSFSAKLMRGVALVALMGWGAASNAAVAANTTDLGALQLDQAYDVPGNFAKVTATFTAPKSGEVLYQGTLSWYSDASHETLMESASYQGFSDVVAPSGNSYKVNTYTYKVTEGTTYYLYNDFSMDASALKLSMGDATTFNFVSSAPAAGKQLAATGKGSIVLTFDVPVVGSDANLVAPDGTTAKVTPVAVGNTLQFDVKAPLTIWYNDGKIAKNSDITLRIGRVASSVGSALYGTDGSFEISFKAAAAPVNLVSVAKPEVFKSFFAPTDAEGKMVLTFSAPVKVTKPAELTFGNREEANFYREEIPMVAEGNNVTLDFSGKLRRGVDMLPTATSFPSTIDLNVPNIIDVDSNYVATSTSGTLGTFGYRFNFLDIAKANVMAQFTPASGESLAGVAEMSVWVNSLNAMTFSGFRFTYDNAGETATTLVPLASATRVNGDTTDEATFTFAIPAEVQGKKNVQVTLGDLVTADGFDHSRDIRAVYDAFMLLESNPPEGAQLAAINNGDQIIVATNYAEKYPELYLTYQMRDLNPETEDEAIVKSASWLNRQPDGTYSATVSGNYKLIRGHEYHLEITAWENEMAYNYMDPAIGEAYITLFGLTEPFVGSDIQLVSVTPADGGRLAPDATALSVEFDGMVTLDSKTTFILEGMGSSSTFKALTPVEPVVDETTGKSYSNIWNLEFRDGFLANRAGGVIVSMKPYDELGRLVIGNTGRGETSCFQFSFETAAQFADFDVNPMDDEELTSIHTIIVVNEKGILPSYNPEVGPITLMELDGANVATVDSIELLEPEAELNTMLKLILDKEVTTPGTYVLNFPEGVFNIGSEFDQYNSQAKNLRYFVVEASTKVYEGHMDPAPGEVDQLKDLTFYFDNFYAEMTWSGVITVTKDDGTTIEVEPANCETTNATGSWDDPSDRMLISLPKAITEAGNYTLTIPADFFVENDDNLYPLISQEFTFSYTVTGNGATPEEPSLNVQFYPTPGQVTELKEIMISLPDAEYFDFNYMEPITITNLDTQETAELYPTVQPVILDPEALANEIEGFNPYAYNYGFLLMPDVTGDTDPATYAGMPAGRYEIVIPAGEILFDDSENEEEIRFTYTVGEVAAPTLETIIYPAPGEVKVIEEFMVWHPNADVVNLDWNATVNPVLTNLETEETITLGYSFYPVVLDPEAIAAEIEGLDLDGLNYYYLLLPSDLDRVPNGSYELVIPAAILDIPGVEGVADMRFLYTVKNGATGVSVIPANTNGTYTVYTLSGRLVNAAATAADITSLPTGIYIINGTKYAVK